MQCSCKTAAGSFGHPQAREYGVAAGLPDGPGGPAALAAEGAAAERLARGFVVTRSAVRRLNVLVVEALVDQGLPAVGLSPCDAGWQTNGRKWDGESGAAAVRRLLQAGLLPVIHGDVVFDSLLGATILSGDTIVSELAAHLRPSRAVFLTNVPGVFDAPPERPGARRVGRIQIAADGSWAADGGGAEGLEIGGAEAGAADTTGGMRAKVSEAAGVARAGVPVLICRAGTEDAEVQAASSLLFSS